jgi:uncharacterized coiled-coil protein SlyX
MQPRTTETTKPQDQSSTLLDNLRRMADEIRVRIHLAGMEAKEAWGKLEPRLHELENKAAAAKDKVVEGFDKVGDELKEQMSKLLDRLKGNDGNDPKMH